MRQRFKHCSYYLVRTEICVYTPAMLLKPTTQNFCSDLLITLLHLAALLIHISSQYECFVFCRVQPQCSRSVVVVAQLYIVCAVSSFLLLNFEEVGTTLMTSHDANLLHHRPTFTDWIPCLYRRNLSKVQSSWTQCGRVLLWCSVVSVTFSATFTAGAMS